MEDQNRRVRLTVEWVRELFAKDLPNIEILSADEALGSGRGDNYTSMLYRLEVKGRDRKSHEPWIKDIIYKVLPESKERRELYKSELLFRNEVVFYTKVWPALTELQKGGRRVFDGVADVYLARADLIAMEDLRSKGYRMADRIKGLQVDQLKHVFKALAGFHALSLALKDLKPDVYEKLSRPDLGGDEAIQEALFRMENVDWYRQYYRIATGNAIKMVSEVLPKKALPKEREKIIIDKFKAFLAEDTFFRNMCQLTSAQGPLSVFCHGDCWTNNFLFKEGQSTDSEALCLVDFQLTRVGSLALDLANVLYCCTSAEERKIHMTPLLQHYHRHLMSSLYTLNPHSTKDPDYMWGLLTEEMRRCGRFGLGSAVDMLPISTCTSEEAPDLYEGKNAEGECTIGSRAPPPGNSRCAALMTDLVVELVDNHIL